jgi:hypothetical protein
MAVVFEIERMGRAKHKSPPHRSLRTNGDLGVGNVVACVLNLTDFIYDVFGAEGIEWHEDLTDRYSTELRDLLERCLSFVPDDRPDFPEVLKEIRKYRLTLQDGLRSKPAKSEDWKEYLLMPETTKLVRVRRIRSRNWDILTTLQGFAKETVANRSSEGALDSPIEMGGETRVRNPRETRCLNPMKTCPYLAAVVKKNQGVSLTVRRVLVSMVLVCSPMAVYRRLVPCHHPWVTLLRRPVGEEQGYLVRRSHPERPMRRQDPM